MTTDTTRAPYDKLLCSTCYEMRCACRFSYLVAVAVLGFNAANMPSSKQTPTSHTTAKISCHSIIGEQMKRLSIDLANEFEGRSPI